MAKNQNTFAKRQREMEKKAKAEAKRARKLLRKQDGGNDNAPEPQADEPDTIEETD
ncbi:MAG: hypothetical protein KDA93_05710 [Planctomycetaceae bacterium]|nr:hypothetical protein [Planctomycetaceae bacterium]